MSVNPEDMDMTGAPTEYVDLEHQVIRQKIDFDGTASVDATPGDVIAEFEPGERQLDREEVAQLVYYRRYATINFLDVSGVTSTGINDDVFAIVDASVGINGDLFREVTTQNGFVVGDDDVDVIIDEGGEIGLLDNYQIYAQTPFLRTDDQFAAGGVASISEHAVDYYNWPTGGPIVDSFDTITCGFGAGNSGLEAQAELRYDFYWDVREQGRSTNPFGRPSVR